MRVEVESFWGALLCLISFFFQRSIVSNCHISNPPLSLSILYLSLTLQSLHVGNKEKEGRQERGSIPILNSSSMYGNSVEALEFLYMGKCVAEVMHNICFFQVNPF